MSAHRQFPQFEEIAPEHLAALLERSNLSDTDRQIAELRICHSMTYAEIGAALGTQDDPRYMDRSTVGKRMRTIIVPRLERLLASENQK